MGKPEPRGPDTATRRPARRTSNRSRTLTCGNTILDPELDPSPPPPVPPSTSPEERPSAAVAAAGDTVAFTDEHADVAVAASASAATARASTHLAKALAAVRLAAISGVLLADTSAASAADRQLPYMAVRLGQHVEAWTPPGWASRGFWGHVMFAQAGLRRSRVKEEERRRAATANQP